jgi:putative transposase
MRKHPLSVGLHLLFKQSEYKIKQISEDIITLEKLDNIALSSHSVKELLPALTNGELTIYGKEAKSIKQSEDSFSTSLMTLPETSQKEAKLRFAFVRTAIKMLGEFPTTVGIDKVIKRVKDLNPNYSIPSTSAVYRWWKRFTENGNDVVSLAQKTSGKAGRSTFLPTVVDEINDVISNEYLINTRPPVSHVYQLFLHRMDYLNASRSEPLRFPSKAQFYRIVGQFDEYDVVAARYGKKYANDLFRSVGKGPVATKILERVEVDHTKLDVMVIDEDSGETIGRPTLTILLDCYSRMILGLYIGFEAASTVSVMRALKQSILPKDLSTPQFENVVNDWPAYGIPMSLICDNGAEFHGKTFIGLNTELGIDLHYCPRLCGSYKGKVERVIGRVNREVCHLIPGTSFSSIRERKDYKSVNKARCTEKQLSNFIYRWLIDIYSHEINKMTMYTPYDLWTEGLAQMSPSLPESEVALAFSMTDEYKRTLTFKGVEIFNMFYNSAALKTMRHKKDSSFDVTVRADPEDISHIWVLDDSVNGYVKVPSIEPEYAHGLSLRQHKRCRELLKQRGQKGRDAKSVRAHRAALNTNIRELKGSTKIRQKEKAARVSQQSYATLNKLTTKKVNPELNEPISEELELETFEFEEM